MATLYLKAAGGNWTAAATWSSTGSGGGDSAGPPTAADDCIAETGSGNLTINAVSVCKSFSAIAGAGNWAGTLTHTAGTAFTISGNVTFSAGMTFTTTTTAFLQINAASVLTTAGLLMCSITATAAITLGGDVNFRSGATGLMAFTLGAASSLDLNGFNVNGFAANDRCIIASNTAGTSRTLTVSGGSFSNCDFRDINFSTPSDLDLSAITGLSGDCGGNTISGGGTVLTFTPSTTQTWTGAGTTWDTIARWTSRMPLPQDDVSMSGCTGGTVNVSKGTRLGRNIDWTGATGTPTWSIASGASDVYGSITLISAMNLSHTTVTLNLRGRGSHTITSAGKTWASSSASSVAVLAFGGTYTLQDAFIKGAGTGSLNLVDGTFDANGFNVTLGAAQGLSSLGSASRTLKMGSGTWTISGSGGSTPWNVASSLTVQADTSTIIFSDVGTGNKTFAGGSKTYNDFRLNGGGAGTVTITGTNTFNRLYTDGGGIRTVILPTTTNIVSGSGLGNGTNVITFTASGATATISKSSGVLSWDYVNLTNIPSAGGATFYAGSHSTDGGGNTGWNFTDAPATPGGRGSLGRIGAHTLSIGIGL